MFSWANPFRRIPCTGFRSFNRLAGDYLACGELIAKFVTNLPARLAA
jgi:hypothetical protein